MVSWDTVMALQKMSEAHKQTIRFKTGNFQGLRTCYITICADEFITNCILRFCRIDFNIKKMKLQQFNDSRHLLKAMKFQ